MSTSRPITPNLTEKGIDLFVEYRNKIIELKKATKNDEARQQCEGAENILTICINAAKGESFFLTSLNSERKQLDLAFKSLNSSDRSWAINIKNEDTLALAKLAVQLFEKLKNDAANTKMQYVDLGKALGGAWTMSVAVKLLETLIGNELPIKNEKQVQEKYNSYLDAALQQNKNAIAFYELCHSNDNKIILEKEKIQPDLSCQLNISNLRSIAAPLTLQCRKVGEDIFLSIRDSHQHLIYDSPLNHPDSKKTDKKILMTALEMREKEPIDKKPSDEVCQAILNIVSKEEVALSEDGIILNELARLTQDIQLNPYELTGSIEQTLVRIKKDIARLIPIIYSLPAYIIIEEKEEYDLHLISDSACHPGKIYLGDTEDELRYEVIGLDGEFKKGTIPRNKLPADFPKNSADVIQSKDKFLPILLDLTSKAGHTQKEKLTIRERSTGCFQKLVKVIDTLNEKLYAMNEPLFPPIANLIQPDNTALLKSLEDHLDEAEKYLTDKAADKAANKGKADPSKISPDDLKKEIITQLKWDIKEARDNIPALAKNALPLYDKGREIDRLYWDVVFGFKKNVSSEESTRQLLNFSSELNLYIKNNNIRKIAAEKISFHEKADREKWNYLFIHQAASKELLDGLIKTISKPTFIHCNNGQIYCFRSRTDHFWLPAPINMGQKDMGQKTDPFFLPNKELTKEEAFTIIRSVYQGRANKQKMHYRFPELIHDLERVTYWGKVKASIDINSKDPVTRLSLNCLYETLFIDTADSAPARLSLLPYTSATLFGLLLKINILKNRHLQGLTAKASPGKAGDLLDATFATVVALLQNLTSSDEVLFSPEVLNSKMLNEALHSKKAIKKMGNKVAVKMRNNEKNFDNNEIKKIKDEEEKAAQIDIDDFAKNEQREREAAEKQRVEEEQRKLEIEKQRTEEEQWKQEIDKLKAEEKGKQQELERLKEIEAERKQELEKLEAKEGLKQQELEKLKEIEAECKQELEKLEAKKELKQQELKEERKQELEKLEAEEKSKQQELERLKEIEAERKQELEKLEAKEGLKQQELEEKRKQELEKLEAEEKSKQRELEKPKTEEGQIKFIEGLQIVKMVVNKKRKKKHGKNNTLTAPRNERRKPEEERSKKDNKISHDSPYFALNTIPENSDFPRHSLEAEQVIYEGLQIVKMVVNKKRKKKHGKNNTLTAHRNKRRRQEEERSKKDNTIPENSDSPRHSIEMPSPAKGASRGESLAGNKGYITAYKNCKRLSNKFLIKKNNKQVDPQEDLSRSKVRNLINEFEHCPDQTGLQDIINRLKVFRGFSEYQYKKLYPILDALCYEMKPYLPKPELVSDIEASTAIKADTKRIASQACINSMLNECTTTEEKIRVLMIASKALSHVDGRLKDAVNLELNDMVKTQPHCLPLSSLLRDLTHRHALDLLRYVAKHELEAPSIFSNQDKNHRPHVEYASDLARRLLTCQTKQDLEDVREEARAMCAMLKKYHHSHPGLAVVLNDMATNVRAFLANPKVATALPLPEKMPKNKGKVSGLTKGDIINCANISASRYSKQKLAAQAGNIHMLRNTPERVEEARRRDPACYFAQVFLSQLGSLSNDTFKKDSTKVLEKFLEGEVRPIVELYDTLKTLKAPVSTHCCGLWTSKTKEAKFLENFIKNLSKRYPQQINEELKKYRN